MNIEQIAKICHQANKAYCEAIDDMSQVQWEFAEKWQKASAMHGVVYHQNNPDATPETSHASWLREKEIDGWAFSEVKNVEAKRHPCMVPYDELPEEQKVKDSIFKALCDILIPQLDVPITEVKEEIIHPDIAATNMDKKPVVKKKKLIQPSGK